MLARPPWVPEGAEYVGISGLSEEIKHFVAFVQPSRTEVDARKSCFERIRRVIVAAWPAARIGLYGSSVTGLSMAGGDIDLFVSQGPSLSDVAVVLNEAGLSAVYRPSAKVPVVTFFDSTHGVHGDITSADPSYVDACTAYVRSALRAFPAARAVILVVKTLLRLHGLGCTYTGGLPSYAVALLVVAYLSANKAANDVHRAFVEPAVVVAAAPHGGLAPPPTRTASELEQTVPVPQDPLAPLSLSPPRPPAGGPDAPGQSPRLQVAPHAPAPAPSQSAGMPARSPATVGDALIGFLVFYGGAFDPVCHNVVPPVDVPLSHQDIVAVVAAASAGHATASADGDTITATAAAPAARSPTAGADDADAEATHAPGDAAVPVGAVSATPYTSAPMRAPVHASEGVFFGPLCATDAYLDPCVDPCDTSCGVGADVTADSAGPQLLSPLQPPVHSGAQNSEVTTPVPVAVPCDAQIGLRCPVPVRSSATSVTPSAARTSLARGSPCPPISSLSGAPPQPRASDRGVPTGAARAAGGGTVTPPIPTPPVPLLGALDSTAPCQPPTAPCDRRGGPLLPPPHPSETSRWARSATISSRLPARLVVADPRSGDVDVAGGVWRSTAVAALLQWAAGAVATTVAASALVRTTARGEAPATPAAADDWEEWDPSDADSEATDASDGVSVNADRGGADGRTRRALASTFAGAARALQPQTSASLLASILLPLPDLPGTASPVGTATSGGKVTPSALTAAPGGASAAVAGVATLGPNVDRRDATALSDAQRRAPMECHQWAQHLAAVDSAAASGTVLQRPPWGPSVRAAAYSGAIPACRVLSAAPCDMTRALRG